MNHGDGRALIGGAPLTHLYPAPETAYAGSTLSLVRATRRRHRAPVRWRVPDRRSFS